jgi:hypothetical protein
MHQSHGCSTYSECCMSARALRAISGWDDRFNRYHAMQATFASQRRPACFAFERDVKLLYDRRFIVV